MPTFSVVGKESGETKASRSALTTFARHETFHLRDGWILKGLRAVREDPMALYAPDAHHHLGVGPNMLQSILYWIKATQLAKPSTATKVRPPLELTRLGTLIFEHDPYLEDEASLWAIHYGLASSAELATFWYWAFNHAPRREFTADELVADIKAYLNEAGVPEVTSSSLEKDAACFIRTYAPSAPRTGRESVEDSLDCPLAELGLLQPSIPGRLTLVSTSRPHLPPEVFRYGLDRYREFTGPERSVFSLDELLWRPLSPGRMFGIHSETLLDRLEAIESAKVTRTAGVNSVAFSQEPRSFSHLQQRFDAGRLIYE